MPAWRCIGACVCRLPGTPRRSSPGFLLDHKSVSLLKARRRYSSHLSARGMCSAQLPPHSECITPKTFIPCQTLHLYAQIHFTDSFLPPTTSYLHSLHRSSAQEEEEERTKRQLEGANRLILFFMFCRKTKRTGGTSAPCVSRPVWKLSHYCQSLDFY